MHFFFLYLYICKYCQCEMNQFSLWFFLVGCQGLLKLLLNIIVQYMMLRICSCTSLNGGEWKFTSHAFMTYILYVNEKNKTKHMCDLFLFGADHLVIFALFIMAQLLNELELTGLQILLISYIQ